jgi:AcrR family transcriptional regulator
MSKGIDTRKAILRRAADLASRIGLQALSIGRLSQEMGMSKSGLFAHFGSKETLQVETLRSAGDAFVDEVIRPAFKAPRGEPRIRALFEGWVRWEHSLRMKGGCIFVQASSEFDDQPGPIRDVIEDQQRGWLDIVAESARRSMLEGHFRANADPEQFAFEFNALLMGYHHAHRMMRDERAESRLERALTKLLESYH